MRDIRLQELIADAEECEKKARRLEEAAGESFFECDFSYGSEDCCTCRNFDFCEANETVREDTAQGLFTDAYAKYGQALAIARKAVQDMESALNDAADVEERLKLLARVLLDIAIHPFTSNFRDCPELWEAQYIWLHLFYRTGKERYGEQAKQCDAFRHAEVVKLNKASKTLEKEGQ